MKERSSHFPSFNDDADPGACDIYYANGLDNVASIYFTCIPPLIFKSFSIDKNLLTVPECPQKNWFECDASTAKSAINETNKNGSIVMTCMIGDRQ